MGTRLRGLAASLIFLLPYPALALGPMYSQHDLVAGEGSPGLEDGAFYSALFHAPLGMAVEARTNRIYLVDRDNHAVRVVELSKSNQVWTLAGNGKAGYVDGPLAKARFDKPTGLALLSGRRIVVNDGGNARLRLIDLTTGTVSTLAGSGTYGADDGMGVKAKVGPIWNMAYLASDDALYFSQPDHGILRRMDLKTGEILTVLKDDIRLPHPAALCASKEKLYVADRMGKDVFELAPKAAAPATSTTPTPAPSAAPVTGDTPTPTATATPIPPDFTWAHLGTTETVLALALNGEDLYAVEANPNTPVVMLRPALRAVDLFSSWGDVMASPESLAFFKDVNSSLPIGLVADPLCAKKFFMAQPRLNIVTSFRDMGPAPLAQNEVFSSNSLMDFDYPPAKPVNVYRILLVGDSHVYHNYHAKDYTQVRMELMAKRLELELNTAAAMTDSPQRFEVLTEARPSHEPLNVWPYYVVPDLVKKFDVDRVLYLQTSINYSLEAYRTYFARPITSEGIPSSKVDPEYAQKPLKERTSQGISKEFLDLCQARKLATVSADGQAQPVSLEELMRDPETRSFLVKMYCKPIGMLKAKLATMKTGGGAPVVFEPFLVPVNWFYAKPEEKLFWPAVKKELGPPFLDLSDLMTAFRVTYYPLSRLDDYDHFDEKGHLLVSLALTRELIRRGDVPLSAPSVPKKAKPAAVLGTKAPTR